MVEPCLEEAPFEELCGGIVTSSAALSIGLIYPIYTKSLDLSPTSSPLLSTTRSHLDAFHESLGDIRGYYPSLDPNWAYLENVLRKIMWCTFFVHAFDFSMAFDEFKRLLTLFASSFLVSSYSHNSKKHAVTYDKLLRAFTASELS